MSNFVIVKLFMPVHFQLCLSGNSEQIQRVIDAGIIPVLLQVLSTGDFKSQKEAAWAVTNFTSGGTIAQLAKLVEVFCN